MELTVARYPDEYEADDETPVRPRVLEEIERMEKNLAALAETIGDVCVRLEHVTNRQPRPENGPSIKEPMKPSISQTADRLDGANSRMVGLRFQLVHLMEDLEI